MAHIHGPVVRQRRFFKHAQVKPLALALAPELRMSNALPLDPGPVGIAPEAPLFVSALVHEFHKLRVGDFVYVDGKRAGTCTE